MAASDVMVCSYRKVIEESLQSSDATISFCRMIGKSLKRGCDDTKNLSS